MCIPSCPASSHVASMRQVGQNDTFSHKTRSEATVHDAKIASNGSNLCGVMRVVQRLACGSVCAKVEGSNPCFAACDGDFFA